MIDDGREPPDGPWNAYEREIVREGLAARRSDLRPVATVYGLPVVLDPRQPPGTFRLEQP